MYEEGAKYMEAGLVWVTEIQGMSMQSRKICLQTGKERFTTPWQPSIGVKVIFFNDLQA